MVFDSNSDIFQREATWLLREKYAGEKSAAYYADLERLKRGEPVAYVIGNVPFLGATIGLASRPLIPRAETEFWVARAMDEIADERGTDAPFACLDLFAGSGCIGIALLLRFSHATVHFGEKEARHAGQIHKNFAQNEIDPARARVFVSDTFDDIPPQAYDYIFANPPYVSTKQTEAVQESVLRWEPRGAIFAGDDGLFYIAETIKRAGPYLAEDGTLFIECGPSQKGRIETLARVSGYTASFEKDQYDRCRVACLQHA